ncbi:hypothetical protein EV127DRAFT_484559 [Xylaria flabelliformis]|nr:hypothetical protein EV127DRAFT_484559 [Xylaria flabelliformis]
MSYQQEYSDSYKETVNKYHPTYANGLEVAPDLPKPLDQAPVFYPPVQERTICGIRPVTFFLSIALAVVVIAAAVGGGIGGSLAVQNAKSACSSNSTGGLTVVTTTVTAAAAATGTATSTTSTTEPLVVPTGVVKLDCPGMTDDIAISLGSNSWVFTPACGIDYSNSDFAAVIVYSFHDCLQACAAHNHFSGQDECSAITFQANQTRFVPANYGNCWLKKGNPAGNKASNESLTAGAKLKGSTGNS